jgi:hypothetical protein
MSATMRNTALAALGGAVVAGRVIAARRGRWSAGVRRTRADRSRWHGVTIALPIDRVSPGGQPPAPLADLGDEIEVQIRPAPGDKGTEILARPRGADVRTVLARRRGADVRTVRRVLRETKSILETGEVLRPHGPPTTEKTLLNRPLEYATRHGREEGTL